MRDDQLAFVEHVAGGRGQDWPRLAGRQTSELGTGAGDAWRSRMANASADEIAELLGDRADDAIVERIVNLGASVDEVAEALDDLEYELRFGEPRTAASAKIDELRQILEELPPDEDALVEPDVRDEDEHEGLSVVEVEERGGEP